MRLVLLITLTMIAFAANSVLNRLALAGGAIDPASFAAVRLLAGAGMLAVLVLLRGNGPAALAKFAPWGVVSLALYVIGFSFAYVTLEAGAGALILFGGVQITMFLGAILRRENLPWPRWAGAGLGFGGLLFLLWPGGAMTPDISGAALMAAAALGWGVYSLIGRAVADPLGATAGNFLWAVPLGLVALLVGGLNVSGAGIALACASGALTSGLGYPLWYSVLPRIETSIAAIAQLTVPLIALGGGILFLNEALTMKFLIASALVLGGVALSLHNPGRK